MIKFLDTDYGVLAFDGRSLSVLEDAETCVYGRDLCVTHDDLVTIRNSLTRYIDDVAAGGSAIKKTTAPSMFAIGSPAWPGLSKLAEESGEVVQVIGKLMGSGGDPAHWDGTDLRARLIEEIADVLAACEFVIATNGIGRAEVNERKAQKLALFFKWHREQKPGGA